MKPYLFSIIVPTYNRSDEIIDLIQSFNNQNFPHERFEVLLIDDGSTDDTEKKVNELTSRSDFRLRFFRRNHEGPGPARNYGMSRAEGEYFLFIDSDCIADESWLSNLARTVEAEKPDAFGGPDSVLDSFTPLQKAIDYAMTSFITTGGMRGHSKKKLAKFYPRSFNMGIHRSIYEKLGGMGTLRHGQDLEFSRRIIASGAKVVSVPDAVVYHKRRTSLRKFFRQMFNWGVARINLTKLDNGILEPLHFIPAIGSVGFTLLLILSIFSLFIFQIWLVCFGIAILIMIIIFFDAYRRYKDLKAARLAPVVAVCQVFAYGYGFTTNYIRRIILGRGEFTGFVKKYYK
ncbi:MAG: glycosyltransferase [Candidatus Marinimicrobia bacterium]|nr:glycosyltransferase [candidate division Zixibacteria bacterium]MCK4448326.1 glycosyltransferase [Candidatus Neomarinimicrobiota bacterium]